MRLVIALMALGCVPSPASAFSPHQLYMLLAAFHAYQSECAPGLPAFSQWDEMALDGLASRFGVEMKDDANAQRLERYTRRMRIAIEPATKDAWCASVRDHLEKILTGFGRS